MGVSLTPHKLCDFDCVYCQVGATTRKTVERSEHVKIQDVLFELSGWLQGNPDAAKGLDYITLSGPGEPLLNTGIGTLIAAIKKLSSVPVALITNSSFLSDPAVRREILAVDLIVPSLDAVTQDIFEKIDCPAPGIKVEDIIEGLVALRKEYRGKIWLEVMLVQGLNDGIAHTRKLVEAVERIRPDKIQLNSPVRCPSEQGIVALERKQMEKIQEMLGDKAEIV